MRFPIVIPALLAALALLLVSTPPSAPAAMRLAKDGKVHACYKAKGKGKGALRVVRNGKVRCPKKWRKVAWYAVGPAGSQGTTGTGLPGEDGLAGTKALEDKVSELLTRVQALEANLAALLGTTQALCGQVSLLSAVFNCP
ncbi:MAG TPA: hypothetical protein VK480_06805 [Solirubrobacterales bacterium]|nr:hypothetical protein [Solirubrobacterales bacterium]